MFTKYKFILFILILVSTRVTAQELYLISGTINDPVNHQQLSNASIKIKGSSKGTIAKDDGTFQLKTTQKLPLTLIVSSVGYKTQEFVIDASKTTDLSILLNTQSVLANQIVVTASRIPESILSSPVTIEKLDLRAIKESPAPTFFDALENVKGVQMTTLSLGYKVPNTRGFAGTTNSRFLQMIDGIDNISPGIGAPVANAVGPTELDIESVELIPGAASALYGLNAINGISNMKTKSPFKYQGLSIYQKVGVNHIDGKDIDPSLYTETALRYAKVIGKKFGFKINASYSQGKDWIANNTSDQYFTAGNKTNLSVAENNPAADLINKYGDEFNSNLKTLKLGGKNYDISRTGYFEKDLTDYAIKNTKLDVGLHYKVSSSTEASFVYRIGTVSNFYQRGNRIRLDGEKIQQHALTVKSQDYFVQAYYTRENTGGNGSFNIRPLAENLDMAFKKPAQWYSDYTKGYNNAITAGESVPDALSSARDFADSGRFLPGTRAFDSAKSSIIKINNWDTVGAQLLLKSAFVHVEGQYDWSRFIPGIQLLTGFNYRKYIVTPDGNEYINPATFVDPKQADKDFYYYSFGGFVQATKKLLNEKLKLIASLRVDKSEYFSPKLNPRIAAVYTPAERHNFRASFQNGYRFPTLFEGFAFVNNGGVKRLGGLRVTSEHLGVFENSYLNTSVTAFRNAVNNDVNNGKTLNQAILDEKKLLVQSTYNYLQPEHLNSFEVGYKGILFDNKLFIDVDYYFNVYDHFIGQLDVTQPYQGIIGSTGGINDSTANYVYTGGKQVKKYKMWTNSKSVISNQGVDLGVTYNFYKKFNISANVSFAKLVEVTSTDAFTPAFNTPKWISNISVGNREVFKNTGFNITWHWQNKFYWNSPLANGYVPAYTTTDAQVTYHLPAIESTLKFGASNIFNKYYNQYIGGPSVGGFYYMTYVLDIAKKANDSK
jgi:outer membrane receptor protein involved in Fe transport